MGGKLERRKLMDFQSENGYLMLTTLFMLILSGIFTHGMIKISANHLIQLHQLSSTYQAKAALNMGETLLNEYIISRDYKLPERAIISTSIGEVQIIKKTANEYQATIIQTNNDEFSKNIKIELPKTEDSQEASTESIEIETQDKKVIIEEIAF